ncbi:MAG: hypothetical protein O8C66_03915 [Candidatus Methanoperedens sp.]|nr:hypothetical protein [Candidatus Methanoperedens sp.]MCZ7369633.1 hypothetical protein [Candidatus Methanoperedens sp.]
MNSKNIKRYIPSKASLWGVDDFIRNQHNIAERWLRKGNETEDIYSKFFFYFAGFNAIYFQWGVINKIDGSQQEKIQNLLEQLGDSKAKEIIDEVKNEVEYFCRRKPIQKMNRRIGEKLMVGYSDDGIRYQKILQDEYRPALERIVSLGQILYLVRSNLVHGSKEESGSGDDFEIIKSSIEPLKVLLTEGITWSKKQCPF